MYSVVKNPAFQSADGYVATARNQSTLMVTQSWCYCACTHYPWGCYMCQHLRPKRPSHARKRAKDR